MNCQYIINNKDEIVFVNADWSEFAAANNANHLLPEKVLNQSLWRFICNLESIHIYRKILEKVRDGHDCKFNIRCDSAEYRRFLEVNITLLVTGDVMFENHILKMETRSPQEIFNSCILRSEEIIFICSWCNRIDIGKEKWQEIENAVKSLRLFEKERLPQLSHGMCPDCYLIMSNELGKLV